MNDQHNKISGSHVEEQLRRIFLSPDFTASKRQRDFLRFVVNETVADRSDEIKAYTIATRVFGRGDDFDQNEDAIVSAEAGRLRRALSHYYLSAGREDPVRIDIPKGTYVPNFRLEGREALEGGDSSCNETAWPTLLIRPLHYRADIDVPVFFPEGFTTDLAIELARYQDIRVILQNQKDADISPARGEARFFLEGTIISKAGELKISIRLTDNRTGRQIWGDQYTCDLNTHDLYGFQEQAARVIAARIGEEQGLITRALSIESRHKPPAEMKTHEAILKFYRHDVSFTPETYDAAFHALEQATQKEPECSQAWTCLGRLYLENYGLEIVSSITPIKTGIEYLEKSVRLDPANQRARLWLALGRMMQGQIREGLIEAENCRSLNPNSLLFMDLIGYCFSMLGKWDYGIGLIQKAVQLNPYHRPYVHHAICIHFLRQKKYEEAYLATLNFRLPFLIWDPILQAASLGHLGRTTESDRYIKDILSLKPAFKSNGKQLISHFMKFDDSVETIIQGLRSAGLHLDEQVT